ncbi:hypothetical protein CBR_g63128 [Chara braunii]|uniref:Uncharacterized protein n=1 Tax=Chara braunii TaxID=69332 RepID=A0A388K944_CHABU|nr:hypothetical protein CBR_g63128 [Chara braunii]|eukprot:GBG66546.1 hypothetical protein CBR_g63128 [Chara braunii]
MFEEGPWITAILNYDGGDEMRLRINVEGGKDVEMRTNGKLQDAIMETKDRVERCCRRDGVTAIMHVTQSYHETETSMDTTDLEEAHVDRDSGGESEMSEAGDRETDLRSWNKPGEIQRHHRAVKPVEEGPEASSRQLTPRGRGTGHVMTKTILVSMRNYTKPDFKIMEEKKEEEGKHKTEENVKDKEKEEKKEKKEEEKDYKKEKEEKEENHKEEKENDEEKKHEE